MTTGPVALRRADWRFLLPAPAAGMFEHLALLGGPPGLGARLREAGVARRVTDRLPAEGGADAIAVLYDAAVAPTEAARGVAPGGVLYYEVDRRRPGAFVRTPARVRRALEGIGFVTTGTYWAVPGFDRTRRYLPLDRDEVLAWYFSTLQTTGSRLAFWADAAVRAVVRGEWHRLERWVPCFGVTAVAGPRSGIVRHTMPSVLGQAEAPAPARSPDGSVALLTSGQDDGSRVVLLPFAPGAAEPSVVVKATRSSVFNGNTEREQQTLHELRSRLDPTLRPTIPEPLGTYRYGDLVVGVESCAPGPALVVSSGRWNAPPTAARDDLRAAADWLGRFHEQARCALGRWDAGLAERVERRLDEYCRRFDPTGAEAQLIRLALDRSKALAAATVPTVRLHNDFGPWNVHRSGTRFTVIDWELGDGERERVGPPLCDLLFFATYWYQRVRHLREDAGELRAIRELFLDHGGGQPAADAAREEIGAYMARLGLDSRLRPLLLVYTWADRAVDLADRRQLATHQAGGPNRFRGYIRLLATRAEQLFAAVDAG